MEKKGYTSEAEQILKEGTGAPVDVADMRDLKQGNSLPVRGYVDQPYLIETDDGNWLLCITKGFSHEGVKGQTVYTMRSLNHGKSWIDETCVEPVDGPEASYAVMQKTPYGRVYIFYNHNTDDIRSVETAHSGTYYRVDSLGHFVFKYSDDNGKTWCEKRYEIPQRSFEIDLYNYHKGKLKYFWNVGKPFVLNGKCYVSLHKIGEFGFPGGFVKSEGVLLCSSNLLTEKDPDKIVWETLPEGTIGIRAPEGGGNVAEEQSYVTLSDGSIFVVFRTVSGHSAYSYSRDGGKTFDRAKFMAYPDGRLIKHPRAANFAWKCANGKFIYWFHNNGSKGYANRNPVWFLGGVEADGPDGKIIKWSQPEILLFDDDPILLISYPDMIEADGGYYITETQKQIARTHFFHASFFAGAWGEKQKNQPVFTCEGGKTVEFVQTKDFYKRNTLGTAGGWVPQRNGFTFRISYKDLQDGDVLFSTLNEEKKGLRLTYRDNNFELFLSDGKTRQIFDTIENFISGKDGEIAVVIDGGPNVVYFVYNGKFCDGGDQREFGWSRMSPVMYGITGSKDITVGKKVNKLEFFEKAIPTNSV